MDSVNARKQKRNSRRIPTNKRIASKVQVRGDARVKQARVVLSESVVVPMQPQPTREMAAAGKTLKGKDKALDDLIEAYEKVEAVVRSSNCCNRPSRVRFSPLDASVVPPPEVHQAGSALVVEGLLHVMLRANACEERFRALLLQDGDDDAAAGNYSEYPSLVLSSSISAVLPQEPSQQTLQLLQTSNEISTTSSSSSRSLSIIDAIDKFIDDKCAKGVVTATCGGVSSSSGERFLCEALDRVMSNDGKGMYHEEIISRFSSIIRYYLRNALNACNGFSPIAIKHTPVALHGFDAGFDAGKVELNIAALFHEALFVLSSFKPDVENLDVWDLVRLRSARKFLNRVLQCVQRLETTDDKRFHSWKLAQRWAKVALAFPQGEQELGAILLLADLDSLRKLVAFEDPETALALIRSNAKSIVIKEQRGAESLRVARIAASGMVGRGGPFPDIEFVLDR